MKRILKILITFAIGLVAICSSSLVVYATEPDMADYTAYPIFMAQSVKPNILIILDNSGSMNFPAYGSYPGSGNEITDAPFAGDSHTVTIDRRVSGSADDAEESSSGTTYDDNDLDLAGVAYVGVRFTNLSIPQGARITNAYITFEAMEENTDNTPATTLTIYGQAADDASAFNFGQAHNISNRTLTSASVSWSPGTWTEDSTYQTPDLSPIVQELVNRDGWNSGNSMVFIFTGTGYREAKAYNEDPSSAPILHVEYTGVRYYGYFDPDARYTYNSNRFERDANGEWSGNWLNWICMRRIDIARKILVGGLATSRTGGGATDLIGDDSSGQSSRYWTRHFDDSSAPHVTKYHGNYWYGIRDGYLYVDNDDWPFSGYTARYNIRVHKDESEEPSEFLNGNIVGVLQRVGDRARFGLEFYNSSEGGYIASRIDSGNITDIITRIENIKPDTWTPLAESFYEGVRYFEQVAPYYYNGDYTRNNQWDPYYWDDIGEFVECEKSFVLLITDGESTQDLNIPSSLQDYDNDGNDPGSYPSNGSDYLDDVALWAHVNDMRGDLDGTQNITFYPVFAFGHGSNLLKNAAKNGGFIDKNGNNIPDLDSEWDEDGNGVPDNYFEAESGYALERKILQAITDILKRAAAGTAVSVLATTGEGEGNVIQAYFRPSVTSGLDEIKWIGYLQSLWVDPQGNLREDTVHDRALNVYEDNIIVFYQETETGDTKVKRYSVDSDHPYPDLETASYEEVSLDDLEPLWEAGELLAQRDPDDRKIFTYLDKDKDEAVDESTDNPFDHSGEVVSFDTSSAAAIKPYLGVADNTKWSYLGTTHDERVENLIKFIRGEAVSGLRNRTIDGNVWKLGDIVHSTPVSISKPVENYHIIYRDESYGEFYNQFKDRETVVYVGANDGMLHALTSWQYDQTTNEYVRPSGAPSSEHIGEELWAYIPQTLLPHLKWLADPDYTHVYYVDLKPKVFDAKILPDDTHYADSDGEDNWGTFILLGLRMGGKHIWSEGDYDDGSGSTVHETRQFYPTYTLIDVTEPRDPRVIWERSYSDLGMSMSVPAIVKVKNKWFAVFGSGPENYDGTSSKKGHIFVVDLKTGEPYKNGTNDWLFETSESNAFMNSPVSLDKDLNYNVDVIYLGEAYLLGSNWKGKLYKVMVPWVNGGTYDGSDPDNYIDNPKDTTNPWILRPLFDATRPITSPVALSIDSFDNAWVYVGSGRYLSDSDKSNSDQQYLFGIKDPFYNEEQATYYHNYAANLELGLSDLFDADPYIVIEGGDVYETDGDYYGTFEDDLLPTARNYDGWKRSLSLSKERVVTKFAVLGGIVFTPSFVPNEDICGFGGESYLYGQYYETGTAYYEAVFDNGTTTINLNGMELTKVLDMINLGSGKASAVGVHIGMEEGAKAFIQQSTGTIVGTKLKPAFNVKSGLTSWREQ